jgi:HK97 family phage portal protein
VVDAAVRPRAVHRRSRHAALRLGRARRQEIGVSALEKLGITLRLEDAAQRFQTAQFANGNRPSLAVTLDHQNPKKELLDLTRANIENLHKGPDRSGKTILLGAGAKVQTLSMSPVEAALIEQRKLDREEVGMVYDLAGPLMNDLTHGTYSNVEELNRGLYRDVVPPWTQLIVETFQTQMIDQQPAWLDHIVAFDFADKLKGTPAELAATLKLASRSPGSSRATKRGAFSTCRRSVTRTIREPCQPGDGQHRTIRPRSSAMAQTPPLPPAG